MSIMPALHTITTTFTCPDCIAEGSTSALPAEAFYWYRVKGWNTKRRSAYCRKHSQERTSGYIRARLDKSSPSYDPAFHARHLAACQRYRARKSKAQGHDRP
jgi:hypothetical protein